MRLQFDILPDARQRQLMTPDQVKLAEHRQKLYLIDRFTRMSASPCHPPLVALPPYVMDTVNNGGADAMLWRCGVVSMHTEFREIDILKLVFSIVEGASALRLRRTWPSPTLTLVYALLCCGDTACVQPPSLARTLAALALLWSICSARRRSRCVGKRVTWWQGGRHHHVGTPGTVPHQRVAPPLYATTRIRDQEYFPLHHPELNNRLKRKWYVWCNKPWAHPLQDIRAYFGEEIAMYFSFLGHYTQWLLAPAFVGVIVYVHQLAADDVSVPELPIFAIFIALWVTCVLPLARLTAASSVLRHSLCCRVLRHSQAHAGGLEAQAGYQRDDVGHERCGHGLPWLVRRSSSDTVNTVRVPRLRLRAQRGDTAAVQRSRG